MPFHRYFISFYKKHANHHDLVHFTPVYDKAILTLIPPILTNNTPDSNIFGRKLRPYTDQKHAMAQYYAESAYFCTLKKLFS